MKIKESLYWLWEYEHIIRDKFSIKDYQDNARIYLDEYQLNEPEIETDNFFYERFLKRK